jgi:predicted  nucleic acid-binding Zn-ribbon protein
MLAVITNLAAMRKRKTTPAGLSKAVTEAQNRLRDLKERRDHATSLLKLAAKVKEFIRLFSEKRSIDEKELQALIAREEQIENHEGIESLNSQIATLEDVLRRADAARKRGVTSRSTRARKPKSKPR